MCYRNHKAIDESRFFLNVKNVNISLEPAYQHQSYDEITKEFQINMVQLKKIMSK